MLAGGCAEVRWDYPRTASFAFSHQKYLALRTSRPNAFFPFHTNEKDLAGDDT